jgi:hypothetical protein
MHSLGSTLVLIGSLIFKRFRSGSRVFGPEVANSLETSI